MRWGPTTIDAGEANRPVWTTWGNVRAFDASAQVRSACSLPRAVDEVCGQAIGVSYRRVVVISAEPFLHRFVIEP